MRVQLLPLRMKEMITVCVFVCVHAQSCPSLCDSMDCSPPGSSIHGILQARILKWSEVKWKLLNRVWFYATPWTIQSMEFSRPEYWSGFPSPGDLPCPGIEPRSPTLQVDSLPAGYWGRLPFPSPGSLPSLGIEPTSRASPALAGRFFNSWATGEAHVLEGK